MADLKNLILYENENTGLDFKAIQYTREKYEDFLKDVLSMANADIEGDRFIVIGVKHRSTGERELLGVSREEFIDQANYQQLIRENIEPDISIEYFPFELEGKTYGIFHIPFCPDKPYMMKKDYNKLKKGDCFIRKGSHQPPMIRADFIKIYEDKYRADSFNGEVEVVFSDNYLKEIELHTVGKLTLPSSRAAEEIKEIIERKRNESSFGSVMGWQAILHNAHFSLGGVPYENRDIETLEKDLETVKETYSEDDHYELFELNSHKINFYIFNQGDRYIEDALVSFEFEGTEGFSIAEQVYSKPKNDFLIRAVSNLPYIESTRYPTVEYEDSMIKVSANMGDIRHKIGTLAFEEPIRMVFGDKLAGQIVRIKCRIYGRNLTTPLEKAMLIKVIQKEVKYPGK